MVFQDLQTYQTSVNNRSILYIHLFGHLRGIRLVIEMSTHQITAETTFLFS